MVNLNIFTDAELCRLLGIVRGQLLRMQKGEGDSFPLPDKDLLKKVHRVIYELSKKGVY